MYKLNLIKIGIPASIKGFEYLNEAMQVYEPITTSTMGLYRVVANRYKTTESRVERAMRHAISKTDTKMTNSEFIATYKIIWDKEAEEDDRQRTD